MRCADTGSFTPSALYACYIMMPLHAAVISLYNHHRTRVCRHPKQEVQVICNTDASHVTSASVSLHNPLYWWPFMYFFDRVFTNSNSKIQKFNSEELPRLTPTQTNEFSPESDSGASRQNRTDGAGTRDYRSGLACQCVIVSTIASGRKSYSHL